ncbi:Lrp/AsnC family transcriptional regulator [Kiloniella majae]|uniref:Lrp/AsnC family transcriptional regulator n=1 Tax=Kiloniella majae TaxID=1938558 RepID=UPI000A279409|nr:Lrp/AsnC family transcriptional regulator [Kiloniella majae]
MDSFDYKILFHVQKDSRMTAEKISAEIGLSPAAVQKRLKRLKDSGVIRAEVALLDPKKMGHPMTVITEVSLERENLNVLDGFKKRMRQAKEVQQCYYTTGEADFIIVLLVRDIQHYEQFTREYFFGNAEVSKFKTNIVMDSVKVGMSIPILYGNS